MNNPNAPRHPLWLALGFWLLSLTVAAGLAAQPRPAERPQPTAAAPDAQAPLPVVHLRVDSPIHPVSARFIEESLRDAEISGAGLVVIELDTPGGLTTSTRDIVTAILETEIPVVVYVAPRGAQAASAGFFILMAADVAAMAPGTNTGAASPVQASGQDVDDTMKAKVEEDTRAFIRSLAQRRGRPVDLAESTVIEARSFSAEEAVANGLADLIAPDLARLLLQLDGLEIPGEEEGDESVILRTAEAPVREVEIGLFQGILAILANPTIAYLLLSLGGLGLMMELYNPGSIFPGAIGAICIVLAFFGLSVLPVNYAGVALILLALLFFIAEIKVVSYGFLTIGGVISLVLGGLMLIKTPEPALRVSWQAMAGMSVAAVLVVGSMAVLVLRTHRRLATTGSEGMIHERGVARSALDPRGKVFVHGELWNAVAESPVAAGSAVEVTGMDRLTLRVRPVAAASPSIIEPIPSHRQSVPEERDPLVG